MSYYSKIISTGSYLPEKILTNNDLAKIMDTSDEWISSRTGIKQRHIANNDEYCSDIAFKAATNAIQNQKQISAKDIDVIIVATTTADKTFPSTATIVQSKLGANNACAFDVQAVCAGFIYALTIADNFIKSGNYNNILVIGSEKMSSLLNFNDRNTAVLFGDGAGAILIQKTNKVEENSILSTHIFSDGNFEQILTTDGGISVNKTVGNIVMNGKEVFKHATSKMFDAINIAIDKNNIKLTDIDWLVPHQANIRIIDMLAKKANLDNKKVVSFIDKHANTSAASIGLALDNAKDKFKKNDLIMLCAIGGGLAWGSILIKW